MYEAKILGGKTLSVEYSKEKGVSILGAPDAQIQILGKDRWHVLYKNKSYEISLQSIDEAASKVSLRINTKVMEVSIKSDRQLLLEKMGLSSLAVKKVSDVKAPMPGLVVRFMVKIDQEVEQGDALLVLEAMKMENIIKSPTKGVISQIPIVQGEAVEKNQVLVKFK